MKERLILGKIHPRRHTADPPKEIYRKEPPDHEEAEEAGWPGGKRRRRRRSIRARPWPGRAGKVHCAQQGSYAEISSNTGCPCQRAAQAGSVARAAADRRGWSLELRLPAGGGGARVTVCMAATAHRPTQAGADSSTSLEADLAPLGSSRSTMHRPMLRLRHADARVQVKVLAGGVTCQWELAAGD